MAEPSLGDCRKAKSKVEKYKEKDKSGPELAKLHQAQAGLWPAQDDFKAKNTQLLHKILLFYNS